MPVGPARSPALLGAGDPSPVVVSRAASASALVLLGDHAGRRIPAALGDLGVPAPALGHHIAWDIGVEGLGSGLADRLGAAFIRQAYSRLVIDCNRALGTSGSVVTVSDGVAVPGNEGLAPEAAKARADEIWSPYHEAISQALDARQARGQPSVLVAVHSFTPVMGGMARPWRYGVLHRDDSAFSRAVLQGLRADLGDAIVGDNEPYQMDGTDFTVPHHADARGLDYLELEVRQDLLATAAGQAEVAAYLAPILAAALAATHGGN